MNARRLTTTLLTGTMLATIPAFIPGLVSAQTAKPDETVEVIVTAQKRVQRLQDVPISIQVLGTKKLDQLNVANFSDFVAQLPSVTFQNSPYQGSSVYIRGVASGGDGNHSGPQPSVGVYLDEQPVTTIGGALDVHIYDIARIESLAGPQGTLYGASSEAGTLRVITNKPDTSGFYGRVDAQVNSVAHGGIGNQLEGMVNIPFGDKIAARLVGWNTHTAGFIDNVPGTRTFIDGPTVNNNAFVKNNYNDADISGGRAALKVDLDDNWIVTASIIGQETKANGSAGYDASVGDLKVQHFLPEYSRDRFNQAALTVQGKIGIFDVTYAGAFLDRKLSTSADYTDYAEAYDRMYSDVGGVAGYFYFHNEAGDPISTQQQIIGEDHFTKNSHELRFQTPQDQRLRFVGGLYYQRQTHLIHQDYQVAGLATDVSVTGHPGTLWLTQQMRIDRDKAVFGELSFDITPTLTFTAGARGFEYDNTLIGFFGFGENPEYDLGLGPANAAGASSGERRCFTTGSLGDPNPKDAPGTKLPAAVPGSPCTNLGVQQADGTILPKEAKGHGISPKLNLTWKITPDYMIYGTYSKGFRPGGINRRADVRPYAADYLTNYEFGFKTKLLDGAMYVNGAIYDQEWKGFQFAFLGANSFTEVHNGPNARIRGLEADVTWNPPQIIGLSLSASTALTDAKTVNNLCYVDGDSAADCSSVIDGTQDFVSAPKGTRLPITPQFKMAANARYTWQGWQV
ncbi:hypothetical protein AEAC466_20810 [Asticcacaulis sp. AC466]|uniref:TonB-dependent receptor n=1 Tax=Asticcacaulis sp. AC466 TaxID=1282362 RepID=UPI0003C3E5BC|nr:TonB-dependent receptor [Asticcacaulis sp. AC466]ESQ81619.1 hypothetical protein AEAC466_20810 [Asticcacaulis sp. AC466]